VGSFLVWGAGDWDGVAELWDFGWRRVFALGEAVSVSALTTVSDYWLFRASILQILDFLIPGFAILMVVIGVAGWRQR
jgi:hypothetical protein